MLAKIYRERRHKEICVVFYEGKYTVLYTNTMDKDAYYGQVINLVRKGLANQDLVSLGKDKFHERFTYSHTIEVKDEA